MIFVEVITKNDSSNHNYLNYHVIIVTNSKHFSLSREQTI